MQRDNFLNRVTCFSFVMQIMPFGKEPAGLSVLAVNCVQLFVCFLILVILLSKRIKGYLDSWTVMVYASLPLERSSSICHWSLSLVIGLTRPWFKCPDLSKWEMDAQLIQPGCE